MTPFKLSKKELQTFNNDLGDCDLIKQDLERARQAGVPNVEHLEEAVRICEERIAKLKAAYAPNER